VVDLPVVSIWHQRSVINFTEFGAVGLR
jgi:hypothetical protein